VDQRSRDLEERRTALAAERVHLAEKNRLQHRVEDFARRVLKASENLDFEMRQRLLRLIVEEVRVTGSQVEVRLRIPLDDGSDGGGSGPVRTPPSGPSSDYRLRSLGHDHVGMVQQPVHRGGGEGEGCTNHDTAFDQQL